MAAHKHTFVETYDGLVAFGFSREVDEKSLIYYLQKFSDDDLMQKLVPRLTDEEITRVFEMLSQLLRNHLVDNEYHEYFLKDDSHSHEPHADS
ncbi:MAG: cytoplasmic protein [Syntrophobacteraceae bacterium]|jgi:TorA maturation chaperone TorD|nr:cytoplasmic protein [Syntrophobacteraceae bacterium]